MAEEEKRRLLVVHGPNLDRLGSREKDIYGDLTLEAINDDIRATAEKLGVAAECYQSNKEGELVSKINSAGGSYDFLIINPGAFTHYSWAIHDALASFEGPVVELHLSNPGSREEFRRFSVVTPVATAVIAGLGGAGYPLAVRAAAGLLGC